jgi:hypothetical protein
MFVQVLSRGRAALIMEHKHAILPLPSDFFSQNV